MEKILWSVCIRRLLKTGFENPGAKWFVISRNFKCNVLRHMIVVSLYHKFNLLMFHKMGKERVFSSINIVLATVEAEDG